MKKALIIIFTVVGLGFIALVGGGIFLYQNVFSTDAQLEIAARKLNEDAPKMVDSITRLDHVSTFKPHGILYEYTIMSFMDRSSAVRLEADVRSRALANAQFKDMIDQGVSAHYIYHTKTGELLADFTISK